MSVQSLVEFRKEYSNLVIYTNSNNVLSIMYLINAFFFFFYENLNLFLSVL